MYLWRSQSYSSISCSGRNGSSPSYHTGDRLDRDQRARRSGRHYQQEAALGSAEGDVEQTPGFGCIGKSLRIAPHDDHTVALKSLGFVNRADGLGRLSGPRMRAVVGDMGESFLRLRMGAYPDRFPELGSPRRRGRPRRRLGPQRNTFPSQAPAIDVERYPVPDKSSGPR